LSTPQNLKHAAVTRGPIWSCAVGPTVLHDFTPLKYINDLTKITKRKSYFFAGDTTLVFSHNNTIQMEFILNLEIYKVQNRMTAKL